jgi:DNA-binding XRE family transcriptional regulator
MKMTSLAPTAAKPLAGTVSFAMNAATRTPTRVKMPKRIPNFTAILPLEITGQQRCARISFAKWKTLQPDKRTSWRNDGRNVYEELIDIPPYYNPAIAKVRAKLRRFAPQEEMIEWRGIPAIKISTKGIDKLNNNDKNDNMTKRANPQFDIKAWREKYDLTPERLSELLGISRTHLSRLENAPELRRVYMWAFKGLEAVFSQLPKQEETNGPEE